MSEHETPTPEPVMRYRGNGSGRIPGVPRRDLTKADVERLRPEALREAMASSLYEIVSGAHLPLNRSAVEETPVDVSPEPLPPVVPDESGDVGRSKRPKAES